MYSVTPLKNNDNSYKTAYEKAKRKNEHLVEKLRKRDAQIDDLRKQLSSVRKSMMARTVSRGRNKMNIKGMDSFMTSNKNVVTQYYYFTVFPHLKWLHPSWCKWLPDNESSFCYKLLQELDVPQDCDDELYWHQDIVPLINKSIIDKRSNYLYGCEGVLHG